MKILSVITALAVSLLIPAAALADAFVDDNGSIHEPAIEAIADEGITRGCDVAGTQYCPGHSVRRGAMAAFLRRALDLPAADEDYFSDDEGSIFEADINALAEAGITKGCKDDLYCPDRNVDRGAMAAFLRRAFDLPSASSDYFADDTGSGFEQDINAIARAKVTNGCSVSGNRYCPHGAVTRAQMASFLARALGLTVAATTTSKPGSTPTSTPVSAPTSTTPVSTPTSTPPPAPVAANQTLTGNIEGAFTGTVAFEGNVNFTGHVTIANGGRLVVRPGVRVEGNGYALEFANGASADIQGTPVHTWSGNGSDANLKRDITFNNMRRIMFHQAAGKSTLKYFSITNSGVTGVLGDYPLHFHRNGDSMRGTIVEGVVVVNGKNHAFVPHASHGITLKDTIAKNTIEAAYWWDTPRMAPGSRDNHTTANDSHDITIEHALADGISGSSTRTTAFALGQGKNNTIVNSLSRNVEDSSQCSGYMWGTDQKPDWFFSNNRALDPNGTCGNGIFVWQNLRPDDPQSLIQDFKSDLAIEHGAYRNFYTYDNIDVPLFIGHALSYTVRNSTIDKVIIEDHPTTGGEVRFTNVQIGSVQIHDQNDEPGTYIFDNTNITCTDVNMAKAHPGSEVIVNDKQC